VCLNVIKWYSGIIFFTKIAHTLQREWKREWNCLTAIKLCYYAKFFYLHYKFFFFFTFITNFCKKKKKNFLRKKSSYAKKKKHIALSEVQADRVFHMFLTYGELLCKYYIICFVNFYFHRNNNKYNCSTRLVTRTKEFNWNVSRSEFWNASINFYGVAKATFVVMWDVFTFF
jgi:hypothetical protein